jgi:hypothetical protein
MEGQIKSRQGGLSGVEQHTMLVRIENRGD